MARPAGCDTLVAVVVSRRSHAAPHCLIIEDEPLIARALVRDVERVGIMASVASSLALALELPGPFDGAIIDVDLPDGCGLDVTSLLPEGQLRSLPVFFSATESASLREEADRRGVFVAKGLGTQAAVKSLCIEIARCQTSGKSGTFLRATDLPANVYDANRTKAR
jgi:CheY-like chemotaxis protein